MADTLNILEELSRDTYISKEDLSKILENAYFLAAEKKYGKNSKLKCIMNRKTGEVDIYHEVLIIDKLNSLDDLNVTESSLNQIDINDIKNKIANHHPSVTQAKYTNIEVGEVILLKLPNITNNRELATIVKQGLLSQIKILQNERQYEEFSSKIGEIFYVTVKQISKNRNDEPEVTIVIDNKNDAILRKYGMIPGEIFIKETKIFVYLADVKKSEKQNQLIFTRNHVNLVAKLLERNVYEIREKTVEIAAIARVPGFKTKVAVRSIDAGKFGLNKVDPVFACIGPRGSIVKEIINELNGEKIDIFRWDSDIKEFIKNALYPIVPSNININNHIIQIIVQEEVVAQAIGTNGNNIKLLSNLFNVNRLRIMTEAQAEEEKIKIEENRIILRDTLEIDDISSNILIFNGIYNIIDIINANSYDLYEIEGISEQMMNNIVLKAKYAYALNALDSLGLDQDLFDILLTLDVDELLRCIKLAEANITTKVQFNELSLEQFKTIVFDTQLLDEEITELLKS